jgi:hypothetical protein
MFEEQVDVEVFPRFAARAVANIEAKIRTWKVYREVRACAANVLPLPTRFGASDRAHNSRIAITKCLIPPVSALHNSLHVTWFQRKQLFHWHRRKWLAAAIARAAGISIVLRNNL